MRLDARIRRSMVGSGGPVLGFSIDIYASIPGGTQPDVVSPPLATYYAGGDAGQTPAGTFGGTAMYDYRFTLPTPFDAAAGTMRLAGKTRDSACSCPGLDERAQRFP